MEILEVVLEVVLFVKRCFVLGIFFVVVVIFDFLVFVYVNLFVVLVKVG